MAQAFNLTAQINLRAPGNLKPVVDTIRRELGRVTADVKVKIDPKSAKSVDAVTRKLQNMNAILVTSTKNTNSLNSALQALSSSLTRTSSASTKISTNIKNTGTSAAQAAKNLQLASTQMEEFGRQAFLAVKRFAAFSIVTTGIYGLINSVNSGLKAFIAFDKELVRLQQVTGKGAIGLQNLEKTIRTLAINLGVSSEQLTEVATTFAQAGLSAEDTRIALQALAKTDLAPSFNNMTETTEGAIAAMRQFGIAAKDLEKSLGSINAVAAAFAVEASDIIAAIQRTGGVFASASKGVSQGSDALNEFIAIFTSVRATTRESAETIATGLRTIFTRIQRSKTIDELKLLGVTLRDTEGKFVGPFEAVKRLSQALNQLDPRSATFAGIVEELGGFRQIGKVIPLIQQFATAQEALKVAQKGQSSLTDAATLAQKSLAVQIIKVKEQFLELIAAVGKSQSFQLFLKTVLSLTSGLISLASAFKPILPFLAILGTIKGISAGTQFLSGFAGAVSKGGGAKGVGSGIGSKITNTDQKDKTSTATKAAEAVRTNTTALDKLSTNISSLDTQITTLVSAVNNNTTALNNRGGGTTLNAGGKVLGFARGGVVPGSGNRDTVPAMLQPGEFVIRKKAVETIGASNLYGMNKYAKGGKAYYGASSRKVPFESGVGPSPFASTSNRPDYFSLESDSGFSPRAFDQFALYAKTNDFTLEEFAKYLEDKKKDGKKYAIGGIIRKYQQGTTDRGVKPLTQDEQKQIVARALGIPYKAGSNDTLRGKTLIGKTGIPMSFSPGDLLRKNADVPALAGKLGLPVEDLETARTRLLKRRANIEKAKAAETSQRREEILGAIEQDKILDFGLVGLRYGDSKKDTSSASTFDARKPQGFEGDDLQNIRKTSGAQFIRINAATIGEKLSVDKASSLQTLLLDAFQQAVIDVATQMASDIKTGLNVDSSKKKVEEAVNNADFYNVIGAGLEASLGLLGAPIIPKTEDTKSIDFPQGLGPASQIFGEQFANMPTDVTRTVGGEGKTIAKYKEQIERWLETPDGQNYINAKRFASGGPVRLYHGSNTGVEDSVLKSFQENGVLPNVAQGYGQGAGFYTWTDRLSAIKHAKNISAGNIITNSQSGGKQMVVELTESLNPKNWDLDYEMQAAEISDFLYSNFDKLGPLLEKSKGIDLGNNFKNFELREKYDEYIDGGGEATRKTQIGFQENDKEIRRTIVNSTGDLRTGAVLGKLISSLRMADPTVTDAFEEEFFANLKPGQAIKYVGASPLKPTNIETFAAGGRAGISSKDTVPALLTPGEFVINKKAASTIGYGRLNRLNKADKIQGYNKGGYVGTRSFAVGGLVPEQQELLRFKAEQSNVSVNELVKQFRDQLFSAFKDIKNLLPKQQALRAYSIEAKNKITGIKASGADAAEQAKQIQDIKTAIISKIQDIDPKMASDALEQRASELMDGLDKGMNIDDILASSNDLSDIFTKTISDQDAYRDALLKMSEATGLTTASMEELVSAIDIQRDQLSESMEKQYGEFGKLFPKLAESFGKTGFGGSLTNIANNLSGDSIAAAIGGKFEFLGAGISEGITSKLGSLFSVPGGVPAILGTIVTTLGSFAKDFAGNDPYAQAAAGALTTGGSYAATGAALGQIFGPPGALAGAIVGGFIGIFEGASEAFQRTNLQNKLEALSKTSADLDEAMVKLREQLTFENLREAEKSLGKFAADLTGLRAVSESTLGFGAYLPTFLGGTPSDVQQEALSTEITGRTKLADTIAEFAQNRLRTLSDAEVNARVSRNQTGSVDEIYNTSIAVDELTRSILIAQKATIGDTESLDEYAARAGAANAATIESIRIRAKEEAAINAYTARRKIEGATDETINEELNRKNPRRRAESIARGEQLIAEQEKERAKAEQLARAIKEVTLQQEKLLDVYSRMGGALDKLLMQMDENIRQTDAYTASLSGNARVIGPDRSEEDVLRNYSRYSIGEVQASASRVSNLLGGGQAAQDVTGSVVAAKVLRDQLPALLRENEGKGADDAIAALEQQFSNLGLGGSEAITEALKEIEKELSTQEGGIISSDVTGKEIVQKLSQTLEAGAEASVKVLETFNDGLTRANEELNKYNEALSKADDYFRKANTIRINSELDLRKALGQRVSFQDNNRAFTEEIRSLTRNIVPGGTTDPRLIGEFIRAESERRRQDVEANSGVLPGAGGTDAAVKSAKELALRQAESARKTNDASQALQRLADSGDLAASALEELRENQRLSSASGDYLQRVLTSDADQLREMNKDLNAYSMSMSGTANSSDYNSLDFRQRSYRGFEAIQSLMPDNIAQQMRARMTRQMLQQTNPQLLNQTAYIDPNGKPISIDSALQQSETGVSPDTQYLVDAYKAASLQQIQANNQLGMNQLQSAQAHYAQMETLFAQLNTNLSNLMADIRNQVKADAAALQRPGSEKPDFGTPLSAGNLTPLGESAGSSAGGSNLLPALGAGALLTGGLAYGRRRSVGPPGSRTTTIGGLVRRKIGERVGGLGEMTREYGRAVSATPLGQKVGGFGRNVKEVASGGAFFAGRAIKGMRLPKIGGKAGRYSAYGTAALAAGAGLYNTFGGGDQSGSQAGMNDLSIADGAINVQSAIINVGGNTELFGDVALDETMTQPAPGVNMGVAALPLDVAAYAASEKLATKTFGQTAMGAGAKTLGPKGSIIGGLALAGIDMGVEAAGGKEAVFGKEGAQVYGTAQNLGGAALTANPALNAINVGVDAFRTTGELLYDFNGKVEGYRAEGEQLLADMETKTAMVGETGAYLWQATDEAAKAFQRPVDSSVKLAVAIYDLSAASAESAVQMQKTSAMFADMQKNKFVYDEQTGEVSKVARSEGDLLGKIDGTKIIDARLQAAQELQLENLNQAQTQNIPYADFAKSRGMEVPSWITDSTQGYANQRKLIEEDIAAIQNRSGIKETTFYNPYGSSTKSVETDTNYAAAVEQEKARLREIKTQPEKLASNTTVAMQETATEAAVVGDVPVSAFTSLSDMANSVQESTDAEISMLDALTLNTASIELLTQNIGMLMSMGGIVPQLPNIPLPSNLPASIDPNLLAQSAYNPATEAGIQNVAIPQPTPIPVPSFDYGQALQEVMQEASTNGKGYASRGFDLTPQRIERSKTIEENKAIQTTDSGPGNFTPYNKLMPETKTILPDQSSLQNSAQLSNILGNFSVSIPNFVNSVGLFDGAVNNFSKMFNNQNANNETESLSLDNKSIEALKSFSVSVAAFGSYVTSLSKLSLPNKVEIIGKYTFDVNIEGAAAFEEMKIELKKELTTLFAGQISELNKELYDKSGGSLGKVTPSVTNVRGR
jgi:TP901 family phage tail tape measure protein